ncbi:hypothetical protein K492DRAFT_221178 [Lichtheimia hyalospora FSU 10163]|nr:hypothetical protein K492DRAFT_221178 [Lichtheimia hyalospora FSU 10163]
MTCDTDEDNDAYKIRISLENGMDDHIKQRFERGLSALLADPYFLLVYVPENGAKMHIVQPAKDSYHRERMVKRINEAKDVPSFYYALSHLWGISRNHPHVWEEVGEYVNNIDGEPAAAVSMRPEKRDALLGLLKDHPDSYWWIDVLCAHTDTPLDIMGDIYSCCLECIAMIDCEPSLLSKLHTDTNMRKEVVDFDWFHAMEEPSPEDLLYLKQQYDKHPELLYHLAVLKQSAWWNRVWTWQEMTLPFGVVRLMAETDTRRLQSNTITIDDLMNTFTNAMDAIAYVKSHDDVNVQPLFEWIVEISQGRHSNKHGVEKMSAYQFGLLLLALGYSTRRCMDPVDYVYGVLGMLQIKIPRMIDPKAIWQCFLSELDKHMDMAGIKNEVIQFPPDDSKTKIIGISELAHQVDLENAQCMADVYDDILEYEEEW